MLCALLAGVRLKQKALPQEADGSVAALHRPTNVRYAEINNRSLGTPPIHLADSLH